MPRCLSCLPQLDRHCPDGTATACRFHPARWCKGRSPRRRPTCQRPNAARPETKTRRCHSPQCAAGRRRPPQRHTKPPGIDMVSRAEPGRQAAVHWATTAEGPGQRGPTGQVQCSALPTRPLTSSRVGSHTNTCPPVSAGMQCASRQATTPGTAQTRRSPSISASRSFQFRRSSIRAQNGSNSLRRFRRGAWTRSVARHRCSPPPF